MSSDVREPKQKRAIEKKQKIIEAGLELFCNKGYHKTNTAEIAKLAGVSTGVVYNYFTDKKDIFMHAIEIYARQITEPLYENIARLTEFDDMRALARGIIDNLVESHHVTQTAHEEMHAMICLDPDVAEVFNKYEVAVLDRVTGLLGEYMNVEKNNLKERVHIVYGVVENYCHELVFHKHENINYDIMADLVTDVMVRLLVNNEA